MAHKLRIWLVVGSLWAGMGIAHAEPCFTRDVNGAPETKCADKLPFALPTGGPGELKVEALAAAGQGFGAQAEGGAPAAPGNAWNNQPGKFGVHGPDQVRQGKQLPVVAPAKPAIN